MDPASASELRDILTSSNTRMEQQEEQIMATGRAVQALVTQVSELTTQFRQFKTESTQQPTALNPRLFHLWITPADAPSPIYRHQRSTLVRVMSFICH